ncbi:MAG: homocysteine S-methyltransferase family protein [Lentisphaerae bacterium]|nr:homocysteine S-methyltransferase family protein [Lentisphaerota bacterium]
MNSNLSEYATGCHLLDGAWGTELERRGLLSGKIPELLNADHPGVIEDIARSYVEAGSEIILTNTFGANRFALERYAASERVEELATAGVNISRRAAGTKAKVFASIGPTGRIVMMQEISAEQFKEAFTETLSALQKAGPDAVVLETFTELEELKLALQVVKDYCNIPVVACMSFSAGQDGTATIMGNSPEELVQVAEEYGAAAIGANCGIGPDIYLTVARRLRTATALPIWIKPNAGLPKIDADGRTKYPLGPDAFASYVPHLVEAGVSFLGGCCGTTPDHIRAIKKALNNSSANR